MVSNTAASAYRAQYQGLSPANFEMLIWRNWAPQKCKFFAWLAIQNRLWTADRLQARGWLNRSMCPLCRCAPETAIHLMVHCRFSVRIWDAIFEWLSVDIQTQSNWQSFSTVFDWWTAVATAQGAPLKALRSVLILVSWEIWKERNASVPIELLNGGRSSKQN